MSSEPGTASRRLSGIGSRDRPVMVVGGGPVGLTAALALAQEGLHVHVLEGGKDVAVRSRASTFHPASLEYLAELGVVDELLTRGLKASTYQLRERQGAILAEFDLGELAGETAFPYRLQCEQHKYCRIVRDRLRQEPTVQLDFDQQVSGVTVGTDSVTLSMANGEQLIAAFVIAADGAHSTVAKALSPDAESYTYPQRFLITSIDLDVREFIPDLAHVSYLADPEDWMAVIHSPDHWRLLFGVDAGETHESVLDPERLQARIGGFLEPKAAGLGADRRRYPVDDVTLYRVHKKVLTSLRQGHVVYIGDAAHLNNPLGGQGMNSGIHDAVTLARTLGAAQRSKTPDDELDRWSRQRREVAAQYVLRDTDANYRALIARSPTERTAHRAVLLSLRSDPEARKAAMRRSAMLTTARIGLPN